MAEVVIAFFIGFLAGYVGAKVGENSTVTKLEEIKTTLEERLMLFEKKDSSPPEHPLNEDNVNRFTKNKLIRAWWIGEEKKKAKEE